MSRESLAFEALPAFLGAAAALLSLGDGPVQLRAPIVLTFLLLGPGMAIVGLLGMENPLHQLTLALAISIGLSALVSLTALYAGWWSPNGILITLIALTLVASFLVRARRIGTTFREST